MMTSSIYNSNLEHSVEYLFRGLLPNVDNTFLVSTPHGQISWKYAPVLPMSGKLASFETFTDTFRPKIITLSDPTSGIGIKDPGHASVPSIINNSSM